MKIFLVNFQVSPTPDNEHYNLIGGGEAHCMIVENDPQSAFIKAKFFTEKVNWKIEAMVNQPIEVIEKVILESEDLLQQYRQAQKEKVAIVYVAWAKDESKL